MNLKTYEHEKKSDENFFCPVGQTLAGGFDDHGIGGSQHGFAQEENPWVGEALPAEGGEFYLYNKSGTVFFWEPIPGVHKVPWDNRDYCAR